MVKYYKRYYNYYKPKGKTYTSRQISNMLRNWGKYKLSVCNFIQHQGNHFLLMDNGVGNGAQFGNIGPVITQCSSWDVIQREWTFFKLTGVSIEVVPINSTDNYVVAQNVWSQYSGSVVVGFFSANFNNVLQAYNAIVESDKCMQLDTKQRQRYYFPIKERDFSRFPAANVDLVGPLTFHVNSQEVGAPQNIIYPKWQLRFTFYITCKDKLI